MAIERSLLGSSHEADYGDYPVELTFPTEEHLESTREYEVDLSTFPDLDELPSITGGSVRLESMHREPSDSYATVRALRVRVMFDRPEALGKDDRDRAMSYLKDARVVAKTVVSALVDRIRVELMQPWLGLSGAEIEVARVSTLEDLDAGNRLPVTMGFGRFVMQEIRPTRRVGSGATTGASRVSRVHSAARRIAHGRRVVLRWRG